MYGAAPPERNKSPLFPPNVVSQDYTRGSGFEHPWRPDLSHRSRQLVDEEQGAAQDVERRLRRTLPGERGRHRAALPLLRPGEGDPPRHHREKAVEVRE